MTTHDAPAKRPARRALALAAAVPWCITPAAFETVLDILQRTNLDPEAVAAQRGEPLRYTRTVEVRGGVAVIPVRGVLARRANMFSEISGATSIDVLATDLRAALDDGNVRAIVLDIDSPGGEANGIGEMAGMIADARERKRIIAYVGGAACSAAYWLASAASEVVCNETALLGSIGVVVTLYRPMEDAGEVEIVSSNAPNKRPDLATDAGRDKIRETLDALEGVFVASVATYRGMTPEAVITAGDNGGIRVGAAAVAAGLADRIGTFEGVIVDLAGDDAPRPAPPSPQQRARASVALFPVPVPSVATSVAGLSLAAPLGVSPRAGSDTFPSLLRPSQENRMSEHTQAPATAPEVPIPPPVATVVTGAVLPTITASDPAAQAQINAMVAQMTTQMEQERAAIMEQAQALFARQMAEMQARQQVETYAQHVTTPTLQRPHALPFTASEVGGFLLTLSSDQRTAARGLFDRVLTAGLVSFEELGSSAEGGEMPVDDRWNAAIEAKVKTGMSRSGAIEAVRREQPDLAAEYAAPRATTKKGGR